MIPTAHLPSWTARRDFPDWLPPSFVKALRQCLRNRGFGVLLAWSQISLGLMFALKLVTGVPGSDDLDRWQWMDIFLILGVILPLWPVALEDEDMREDSRELLRFTRVSARNIVDGKLSCVFAQAAILLLGMLPYRFLRAEFGWQAFFADMELFVWVITLLAVLAPWGIFLGALPLAGRVAFTPLLLGVLLVGYSGLITILQKRAEGVWYSWFLIASVVCMVGCSLAVARYDTRNR